MNRFIIIKNGKINFKNLVLNKIAVSELIIKLKNRNIKSIEFIKSLYVYRNIYIFKIDNDLISLVIDGKIVYSNAIRNREIILRFKNILKKYKISIKEVMYAFYNKDKLFIIRHNN